MRRTRATTAVAVVGLLLLSACSEDEAPEVETVTITEAPAPGDGTDSADSAEATEGPDTGTDTEAPRDSSTATETPGDDTTGTASPTSDAEVEALEADAAQRAQDWVLAFVNADPQVCAYILNTAGDGPMTANQADRELCEDVLVAAAEASFDEQMATIIGTISIEGAAVDSSRERAVVDGRHVSSLFAEALGAQQIVLVLVDDEWLVDVDQSFQD